MLNRLTINTSKTSSVLYLSMQKRVALNLFNGGVNIDLNGTPINRNHQTKFLGVLIDQDFQWNSHINYVSRKVAKCVRIIYKVRCCLTLNSKVFISWSIYSHLSCCTVSWGNTYPTKLNCLPLLHKRVLRIITQSGWRDHSRALFTRLGVENIFRITKLQMGELVYKQKKRTCFLIYL